MRCCVLALAAGGALLLLGIYLAGAASGGSTAPRPPHFRQRPLLARHAAATQPPKCPGPDCVLAELMPCPGPDCELSEAMPCPGPDCELTEPTLKVEQCPGPKCQLDETLEETSADRRILPDEPAPDEAERSRSGPRGRSNRRRGRLARRRHRERLMGADVPVESNVQPQAQQPAAAQQHAAVANLAPGFEAMRPLSPLPRAYLLQLDYMRAHPHNRPGLDGDARRGHPC